ncbi:unnamed protein product (macronuclear) [Paramecium tetraurelia]|uniref:Uncharacterized protein n=1 Tax=Paramecium tetraurelia TaxID=5888 RepID=A0DTM5_PARTE|nr:uncharacterized protein GSPATT00020073001 [Paramecium tetraurelia]CAK86392.1 unnamed protein product [Paramecium tetraurelia]|eukprot:XP_001453789.1 hypothetical protein (macronuclear) [Paramecium tetraurelia strain d4-2]
MQQQNNLDEISLKIRQRKQTLSQIREVLVHDKYFEDTVSISKSVDILISRGKIDVDIFLKKIIIFGMLITQSLEIRNNQDKINAIGDYCKMLRDANLVKLSQKEEMRALIQQGLPDVRLKLLNDMQLIYNGMIFPQNLSFKSVTNKICLIIDIIYNSFADSIYLGQDFLDQMEKSDQILQNLVIVPIQSYIEQLVSIQFEEETKHLLSLNGICVNIDLDL